MDNIIHVVDTRILVIKEVFVPSGHFCPNYIKSHPDIIKNSFVKQVQYKAKKLTFHFRQNAKI